MIVASEAGGRTIVDVATAARELDGAPAHEVLAWASAQLGRKLTFATGFGAEGCVIIDLIARHALPIDLFTLDTGLLFPETYELWRRLEARYGVTIRAVRPAQTVAEQAGAHGDALWERDAGSLLRAAQGRAAARGARRASTAWITAIRREQTPERAYAQVVEHDAKFGLVKVNPLVAWTHDDVWAHVYAHDVPFNPLHERGYPSIGCAAVHVADRARRERCAPVAGAAPARRECGLHGGDTPLRRTGS